jgi:hypothetical protein
MALDEPNDAEVVPASATTVRSLSVARSASPVCAVVEVAVSVVVALRSAEKATRTPAAIVDIADVAAIEVELTAPRAPPTATDSVIERVD